MEAVLSFMILLSKKFCHSSIISQTGEANFNYLTSFNILKYFKRIYQWKGKLKINADLMPSWKSCMSPKCFQYASISAHSPELM